MFRHPNVIAALVRSGGMLISSALLCAFIHGLAVTLDEKQMAGGTSVTVPDHMTLYTGNSSFHISLRNDDQPLVIQQKP